MSLYFSIYDTVFKSLSLIPYLFVCASVSLSTFFRASVFDALAPSLWLFLSIYMFLSITVGVCLYLCSPITNYLFLFLILCLCRTNVVCSNPPVFYWLYHPFPILLCLLLSLSLRPCLWLYLSIPISRSVTVSLSVCSSSSLFLCIDFRIAVSLDMTFFVSPHDLSSINENFFYCIKNKSCYIIVLTSPILFLLSLRHCRYISTFLSSDL